MVFKVYDQGQLDENWDGTEEDDDDEDNEFQSNEKYFFKIIDKTSEDDDGTYTHSKLTVRI